MFGEQGAIEKLRNTLTTVGCDPLPRAWVRRLALEKKTDEEIVWVARPTESYGRTEQAAWVAGVAVLLSVSIRFSDLFTGYTTQEWGNWFIPLVSLLAFLVLVFFVWFSPRWSSSKTLYVLTNQRAMLMRFGVFFRIRAFELKDIRRFTRFELEDGNGDLVFERFSLKDEEGNMKTGENGFYGIADVRQVEKMLQTVIDKKEQKT